MGGKAEHATVRGKCDLLVGGKAGAAAGVTLRLYEIPDGARVTTAVGGREFVTSRTGDVIRVEARCATGDAGAGDWRVWHAGRIVPGEPGGVEFTV